MRDALRITTPAGPRWDLALDLMRTGEGAVAVQDLVVYRDVHGPRSTGRLQIEVVTLDRVPSERQQIYEAGAETLQRLRASDARLDRLLDQYGFDLELVYDDGYTRVRLTLPARDQASDS